MRTRLLRPEFWADSRMADLPYGTRLTYMGLWCLADDDGYLRWELRDIAAELYRYESPRKRESRVEAQLAELTEAGRVQVLPCGIHAIIKSLPKYRVKGGTQTSQNHKVHTDTCEYVQVHTSTDKYLSVSVSVSGSVSGTVTSSGSAGAKGSKEPKSHEERVAYYRALEADESLPAAKRALYGQQAEAIERQMVA